MCHSLRMSVKEWQYLFLTGINVVVSPSALITDFRYQKPLQRDLSKKLTLFRFKALHLRLYSSSLSTDIHALAYSIRRPILEARLGVPVDKHERFVISWIGVGNCRLPLSASAQPRLVADSAPHTLSHMTAPTALTRPIPDRAPHTPLSHVYNIRQLLLKLLNFPTAVVSPPARQPAGNPIIVSEWDSTFELGWARWGGKGGEENQQLFYQLLN